MPDGSTIKDFLVGIKFNIDESTQNRFRQGIQQGTQATGALQKSIDGAVKALNQLGAAFKAASDEPARKFEQSQRKIVTSNTALIKSTAELGRVAVAGATAFAAGILTTAKNYEQLYYIAQRTGGSVAGLETLISGFKRIGLSSDDAKAAVLSLQEKLRTDPIAKDIMLKIAHVTPEEVAKVKAAMGGMIGDTEAQALALAYWLEKQSPVIRKYWEDYWGISDSFVQRVNQQRAELEKGAQRQADAIQKAYGGTREEAKKKYDEDVQKGVDLQKQWNEAIDRMGVLWTQFFAQSAPRLEHYIHLLEQGVTWLIEFNQKHPGAAEIEAWAAMALGATTVLALFGKLLGIAGPLTAALRLLVTAVTFLISGNPIGIALLLIAGAAWAIYTHWDEIAKAFEDVKKRFNEGIDILWKGLNDLSRLVFGQNIIDTWNSITSAIEKAYGSWRKYLGLGEGAQGMPAAGPYGGAPAQPGDLPPGPPRPPGPSGQHGGIVTRLHEGEMVLPVAISRGLQALIKAGTGGGQGDYDTSRSMGRLGDWLTGLGIIPRVTIENFDDLIQELTEGRYQGEPFSDKEQGPSLPGSRRPGRGPQGDGDKPDQPGIPFEPDTDLLKGTGLRADQLEVFREYVAKRESGGDYGMKPSANRLGYMGRYQMGGQATGRIRGEGYDEVKKAAERMHIKRPTDEEFLADKELQEKMFQNYTLFNHNELMRRSKDYRDASPEEKAAILMGAHLGGVGGVIKHLESGGKHDPGDAPGKPGGGTHISDYLKAMRERMKRARPPAAPAAPAAATPAPAAAAAGGGRPGYWNRMKSIPAHPGAPGLMKIPEDAPLVKGHPLIQETSLQLDRIRDWTTRKEDGPNGGNGGDRSVSNNVTQNITVNEAQHKPANYYARQGQRDYEDLSRNWRTTYT